MFRAVLNIIYIYFMNKFAHRRQHYFATRLFGRFLSFSYKDLVLKNSSSISQVIFAYTSNLTQIIAAYLTIFAEVVTVGCVYAMLFYVNWKMTLVLSVFLSVKVYSVIRIFSKRIAVAGVKSREFSVKSSRLYTASFWNFKFLKLVSHDGPVREKFAAATLGLAKANTINSVFQALPRFILETIGFSLLVAVIMYVVWQYNDASFVIPMVSMYALAFYRFLPSINKMVMGYNQIMFNKHVLKPLWEFLNHTFEELGSNLLTFKRDLVFEHVSFGYSKNTNVLNNVNLVINKGLRIGFVGESGAGKSTMADVLMGLFKPDTGKILIDGVPLTEKNVKSWRRMIGYIPQQIFLFQGTVADNVVCGRQFNEQRLIEVLKKAKIYDFLQTKEGIYTKLGEGGINVSGGQKQRIAIARALYSDPAVLVLDEATSALDNQTEEKIMQEVYSVQKDKTLIIIAHRLSTIERCDKVYKIDGGRVFEVGINKGSVTSGLAV